MAQQTLQGNSLTLGAAAPGGTVTVKPAVYPQILPGGIVLAKIPVTGVISSVTGFFTVSVTRGADVVVILKDSAGRTFFSERITISGDATVDLSTYFSDPASLASISTPLPAHAAQHGASSNDPITPEAIGALSAAGGAVGDGVNQMVIAPDGTIRFEGSATVYDDLPGPFVSIKVQGTGVSINAAELTIDFTDGSDLNDYAYCSYQQSHKWIAGSPLGIHFHWEQASANVPNFLVMYRYQKNGGAKTTAWTSHKCNTPVYPYVSGTLNQICHGLNITPADYDISDVIQVRLFRDNSNASGLFSGVNSYAGLVACTSMDIHYGIDMVGSSTEFAKNG